MATTSHLAVSLDNRVSLVEHELNGIKASQTEISAKLDGLATSVTSLVSRPAQSIANLLQMGLHAMLLVGTLATVITFVSGAYHADKFSVMREQILSNQQTISILQLKLKHGIKE